MFLSAICFNFFSSFSLSDFLHLLRSKPSTNTPRRPNRPGSRRGRHIDRTVRCVLPSTNFGPFSLPIDSSIIRHLRSSSETSRSDDDLSTHHSWTQHMNYGTLDELSLPSSRSTASQRRAANRLLESIPIPPLCLVSG